MRGDVQQSPYDRPFEDYQQNVISIHIEFDNVTRVITLCSVHRDAACQYSRILIGVGADGSPETTKNAFPVPIGDRTVNINQLKNNGINTIEDVLALQITAGK